jgi:4-carboxymuconolactone decarboxylase
MIQQPATPAVIRPELRSTTIGPPRLEPPAELPPELEEFVVEIAAGQSVRRVIRTLAHNPRVMKRFFMLSAGLLGRGVLPARQREIVILRMGWRCGSVYEYSEHTAIALNCGLTNGEIRRLTLPLDAAGFNEDDAALIAMVDELYEGNAVSDETWKHLRARWHDAELVELLELAGRYWQVSCVLNSFRVKLEDGAVGWPAGVRLPGLSAPSGHAG